jgi:tetratricopeptide (TPR) repeat protein
MKKIALLVALSINIAFAQKLKVGNASIALQNGDIPSAISNIEEAMKNEESLAMPKTWLVRGDIFKNVYETKLYIKDYPNALNIAKESYIKAFELETNPKKKNDAKPGMINVQSYLAAEGIDLIKASKAAASYVYLKKSVELDEFMMSNNIETVLDTNAVFALVIAGVESKQNAEVMPYVKKLIDVKFNEPFIYQTYIDHLIEAKSSDAEMYLDLARQKFPENGNILISEINYYLGKGESNKVLDKLNEGISKQPDNASMYFSRGTIFEKTGKLDEAMADYTKATTLKPDFLEAVYSQGALYYNQAIELNKKMNEENDIKKYNIMKVDRDNLYNKALPFLEKAYEMDKTDNNTLIALKEIYAKMNMIEKYNKVKNGL